ncbi:MAG: hydratase [Alphaproteobacteria bacterium]|nr:hydratase [Alphaproteobacteria bacterium]
MANNSTQRAAELLAQAWMKPGKAESFPDELRPKTREDAYAIQDAMASIIGQASTGWKLGATSPAMRRKAGHDGPIIGRIFEEVTFLSPARLPIARFPHARAECEFAFRLLTDIPARPNGYAAAELAQAVTLHLAVEIIGNRYPDRPDFPRLSTIDEIADNGTGIGFVFGAEISDWRNLDLRNLVIDMKVDARPPAENFLGEDRCQPIESLAQAVQILCSRGISIKTGEYVSTGAATDPQPIGKGSTVRATFGDLGMIAVDFD